MNNNMEKEIFDIYVDDIIPNRFQPRLTFDEKSLNELAESIKQHGIIQPLVVRKVGDKYEIIAGERRYKASQIAGLQKVPAVIMNLDDKQSAEVAVIENIQRRDLSALEEAESYKKLLDKGYLTQEQLASRMGKAQATISNKLRLLGLSPEVKDALLKEKISERHARSLLSLKNANEQKTALDKIINNKLTVRQTDDLIKSMLGIAPTQTINDSVETLDFAGNQNATSNPTPVAPSAPVVPSFSVTDSPIKTPVAQAIEPITEPVVTPTIPFIDESQTGFAPISNIDVNQIKEAAEDIHPVEPLADVNKLLGIDVNKPIAPVAPVSQTANDGPRFINLEDEETNMDMGDATVSSPIQTFDVPSTSVDTTSNVESAPATNQESVIPTNNVETVAPVADVTQNVGPLPNPFMAEVQQESAPATNNDVPIPTITTSEPQQDVNTSSFAPIPNPFANVMEPEPQNQPAPTTMAEPKTFTDSLVQEFRQSNTHPENATGVVAGDLRSAINSIREVTRLLEKNNFKVDVEEFDFEKLYQIIIKIEK